MKSFKLLAVASALAVSFGAQATVTGSLLASSSPTFLTLSPAGLAGVATLDKPADVLTSSLPLEAAMPVNTAGMYLSAGSTGAATLTFTTSVNSVSFLWGSPDTYNVLTVNSTGGAAQQFTASSLAFPVTNGLQTFAQYVLFTATGGSTITSLTFDNVNEANAFEVSNFKVTTPVPEPETYALLLAGLGAIGFIARRQQKR